MQVGVLPGAELTERLQRGGGHVAERGVVAQQQEGQHLKPQRQTHTSSISHPVRHHMTNTHTPA